MTNDVCSAYLSLKRALLARDAVLALRFAMMKARALAIVSDA